MGTALVTGATSGLGEEFCWQLASAGHNLVLVARREELLHALAQRLTTLTGVRAEVLPADLSVPEDLDRVAARLDADGSDGGPAPVGLLVNNAGYGLKQRFVGGDLAAEEQALDVMVRAVMVLSHHAANAMKARGRGAILNVASVAAETGGGTYSAHKAWVRAFTEGLAIQLRGTGVRATCVMPGMTKTPFFEAAGFPTPELPEWAWSTSEQVVEAALAAVRDGRVLVVPHPTYKVAMGAMRLAPRWLTRKVVAAAKFN